MDIVFSASALTDRVASRITASRLVDLGEVNTIDLSHIPPENTASIKMIKKAVMPIGPTLSGVVFVNKAAVAAARKTVANPQ